VGSSHPHGLAPTAKDTDLWAVLLAPHGEKLTFREQILAGVRTRDSKVVVMVCR
jgi:hypothetical protein